MQRTQKTWLALASLAAVTSILSTAAQTGGEAAGLFSGSTNIGGPTRAGTVTWDPGNSTYRVSGGGANMWFTNDAFHFVWKKVSGDASLAADIEFVGTGGNAHRKACLIIRQGLEPDAAYADAALHGDGLTSLQYRAERGARTYEIQANTTGPRRLRIEKRGAYVSMSIAGAGEPLRLSGGSTRVVFKEPFYVGLGVCAHDDAAIEQAVFSKVELIEGPRPAARTNRLSTLETVPIASRDRRVVFCTTNHIEAPNWMPDGQQLLFNSQGLIYRIPVAGGTPQRVDTGFATRCNNDHGISPDGKRLVISDQSQEKKSLIYTLPIEGGTPQRVTRLGPSYWHGWSPDGRTLAYCAERGGEYDVYTIPVTGGEETRLTTAKGLDDGPEYSPDGKFIYFNSDRTGTMQIWRMHPDGSNQEQITRDELNNWFPHPSPDGRWLVFLTYEKEVKGHPENQDVKLRLMPVAGGPVQELASLYGGQGTINVPSWSPDSKKVAFVSYQWVEAEGRQP